MKESTPLQKKVFTSLWSLFVSAVGFYYAYDAFYSLAHPFEPGDHLRMGTAGNTILGIIFAIGGVYYLVKSIVVCFKKDGPSASQ